MLSELLHIVEVNYKILNIFTSKYCFLKKYGSKMFNYYVMSSVAHTFSCEWRIYANRFYNTKMSHK
jgi:hypothetical protein